MDEGEENPDLEKDSGDKENALRIDACGVGKVLASGRGDIKKDDLVAGLLSWGEYCVLKEGSLLNKLDPMGFPLSHHVGILGFSGLSAYCGLFEICKPEKGEKVFVSAASGSVGNLVGQYAKLFGCYVVGCAGSQQKVNILKEKLGFDDAFNYNEESDLNSTLKRSNLEYSMLHLPFERCFPEGIIDIYFDNVGGRMLEAAVANMNPHGRVAACGVISEYTNATERAAPNMIDVIYKRIKIQGFLSSDFMNVHADFHSRTLEYLKAGKIKVLEDISHGVENIPSAFIGLFRGDNIGKKMVQIADE
nr:NADP-dependent alkenal double bond reductase P2-like [Ipomoea batatas]GMD75232.1 NADP-dependent alkenal double bond reductase P2-like [Ipomoea batatas]GMD78859.1 NADP-dependent alkenal double bond reductase P2-like [Ipomoea batatas]